jgi:hypothetical protein
LVFQTILSLLFCIPILFVQKPLTNEKQNKVRWLEIMVWVKAFGPFNKVEATFSRVEISEVESHYIIKNIQEISFIIHKLFEVSDFFDF